MNIIETIRAEIERRKNTAETMRERGAYIGLLAFLDTLPESAKRGYKDCNGCEYNRTVKDQIGWQFHGCFGGEYKGKPIAEIELCPLKVATLPEQPVEGLEEEINREIDKLDITPGYDRLAAFARHFAEWGASHAKTPTP